MPRERSTIHTAPGGHQDSDAPWPQWTRIGVAGLLLALLAGCRLEVSVPTQGTVVTADGGFSCGPGESCVIEVSDTRFDETFIAVPAPGYTFSHWKKADRHFCGKRKRTCRLFTSGFTDTDLMQYLESDETFTLAPVFVRFNQAYWTQVAEEIAGRQFTRESFLYAITPNVDQCDPGQLTAEAKSRALQAVNEVRALHQLPAADYATGYDSEVQQASLVQVANGYLSHKPKDGDKCFSADAAAGAGSSNLFKASSASDPARDIFAWTNDDTNSAALAGVGHRRWILSPRLGQVAYGKVRGASALKVFRFARQVPRTFPPQISYVAMPSGMYPHLLVSPRTTPWSISTVSAGAPGTTPYNYFAEAKVSVRETGRKGQELVVHSLYSKANGPIRPSFLSWMVDGWKYDTEYIIRVTNIQQPDGAVTEFRYPVRILRERLRGDG